MVRLLNTATAQGRALVDENGITLMTVYTLNRTDEFKIDAHAWDNRNFPIVFDLPSASVYEIALRSVTATQRASYAVLFRSGGARGVAVKRNGEGFDIHQLVASPYPGVSPVQLTHKQIQLHREHVMQMIDYLERCDADPSLPEVPGL